MVSGSPDQDDVQMLTLITPMRPLAAWWVRLWLAISRLSPKVMAIGALHEVQFTNWSVVTSFAYNGDPQLPERPARAWLVWTTAWTGRMDPYVEAFARGVAARIRMIWGPSYRFPGTRSVARLRAYIVDNARPGGFTYVANPRATVRTVESARRIAAAHDELLAHARTPNAADFRAAYNRFLVARQGDL